ncbi:MAG TPA: GH25 family lysozyme [Roseiarcus sp.]|jgi:lysozyme
MPDSRTLVSRGLAGIALALAATVSGCGGGTGPLLDDAANLPAAMLNSNLPKPHDYPVHGIDVSKFQGEIDWNAVASSGVKFAWIKASEGGDHADARFQANWEGAKAAGVPHGAYHFVYWCRSPMEEMAFFEQNAPVEQDALPPVLDVEATPTSRTCHRHLTQAGAVADMKVMLQEMERHYGKRPIIYTTVDFYEAILSDGAFSDYPIWVRSTKHNPAVKYGSRAWAFWQYQSDGQTPGIHVNVDRDVFYGTKEQWDAFLREPLSGPRAPSVQQALTQQLAEPNLPPPQPTAEPSVAQQDAIAQQLDDSQAAASQPSNQE